MRLRVFSFLRHAGYVARFCIIPRGFPFAKTVSMDFRECRKRSAQFAGFPCRT